VLFVNGHSLGARSGRKIGRKLSIAVKNAIRQKGNNQPILLLTSLVDLSNPSLCSAILLPISLE